MSTLTTSRPSTPFAVVDPDRLRANIDRVARLAADRGQALRPHAKTHRCPQIAALQLEAGASGLTVATLGEAEVFADAGCTDLLIAYPVWWDADRGGRVAQPLIHDAVWLSTAYEKPRVAAGEVAGIFAPPVRSASEHPMDQLVALLGRNPGR